MRRLFTFADRYYRQRDWKMLVPLKFCLLAAGCLMGLTVKKERKRPVALAALVVFFGTYVPLMIDMLQALPTLWPREKAPEEEEAETPDAEEEAPADAPAEAAQETPEDEPAQVSEETVAEETEAPEAPAEEPAQPAEEAPQEASEEAEAPGEPAEESDEEEVSAPI